VSICRCACATTHRESIAFQGEISVCFSHYFANIAPPTNSPKQFQRLGTTRSYRGVKNRSYKMEVGLHLSGGPRASAGRREGGHAGGRCRERDGEGGEGRLQGRSSAPSPRLRAGSAGGVKNRMREIRTSNEPERHRVVSRRLQLAARKHARPVAINQNAQQHSRMIRRRPGTAVPAAHRAKIESVDNTHDKPRQ
jgi:hypothetical protein